MNFIKWLFEETYIPGFVAGGGIFYISPSGYDRNYSYFVYKMIVK